MSRTWKHSFDFPIFIIFQNRPTLTLQNRVSSIVRWILFKFQIYKIFNTKSYQEGDSIFITIGIILTINPMGPCQAVFVSYWPHHALQWRIQTAELETSIRRWGFPCMSCKRFHRSLREQHYRAARYFIVLKNQGCSWFYMLYVHCTSKNVTMKKTIRQKRQIGRKSTLKFFLIKIMTK